MPFGSLAVFGAFFNLFLYCIFFLAFRLIDCAWLFEKLRRCCRCCRCGRWMSSYKSNRAGSWCSLWGFRRCGLFAFIHICLYWNNWLHCHVAFTWCQNYCWHLMLPYHGSVFGLLLTKAQQSPSGTVQQSMKSQACFSVLFVLFVFTFDCCCFKRNSMSE